MVQIKIKKIFKVKGIKRLFVAYGILNLLISNIVLQSALFLIPTLFATVLSQLVNLFIGYYLYGKKVFKLNELNNLIFKKYLSSSIIAWILNYFVIEFFFNYGINKNLTAILIIPILVYFSFLSQKYYVFRR